MPNPNRIAREKWDAAGGLAVVVTNYGEEVHGEPVDTLEDGARRKVWLDREYPRFEVNVTRANNIDLNTPNGLGRAEEEEVEELAYWLAVVAPKYQWAVAAWHGMEAA